MISPSDLTKENGFEDGIVVEYETMEGRTRIDYFHVGDWKVKTIRPITGPMSIWNHAYDDATHLSIDGAGRFQFCTMHKGQNPGGYIPRPFWAKAPK